MVDFATARKVMVENQIGPAGVTEFRLVRALGTVPRENFVPVARRDLAYIDEVHALAGGRFLPAPVTFARLAQLAEIAEDDSVLDFGAATGYGTAVLAMLGRDVVGLEADAGLAEMARANLAVLDLANATLIEGDHAALGDRGFNVIVVQGILDAEPTHLLERLRPGGRLVAVLRRGVIGSAMRYRAVPGRGIKKETHFDVTLPPFYGASSADEFVF